MNYPLKIPDEHIHAYVKREAIKKISVFGSVWFSFMIVSFLFTHIDVGQIYSIFFYLLVGFTVVAFYLSLKRIKVKALATEFYINENFISVTIDETKFNVIQKIRFHQQKYCCGEKSSKTIPFSHIESTKIKSSEIQIRSIQSSFLSRKGLIIIPKELELYDDLTKQIISNKEKFHLVE